MSYEKMRDKYFSLIPVGHLIDPRAIDNQPELKILLTLMGGIDEKIDLLEDLIDKCPDRGDEARDGR